MLSDIGEVTEAESTPGRRLPGPAERRMLKQAQQNNNSPIKSSPTIGYEAVMKRARAGNHMRKFSIESTSTVKSEGQPAEMFRDFDDGVSVDDSVFQGDDEESVADSYTEGVIASETHRLSRNDDTMEKDENGNSSAALSRRAEQILLNAKRRLNVRVYFPQRFSFLIGRIEYGRQPNTRPKLTIRHACWLFIFNTQQQSSVAIDPFSTYKRKPTCRAWCSPVKA